MQNNNIKVYAVDPAVAETSGITDVTSLTDEEFMFEAKECGMVWSLKGFEEAFNDEQVSDQWFIKII